jgi:hypothetical protein
MTVLHRTGYRRTRMPALMTDTATVIRLIEVPDGAGGTTITEQVVGGVACSLQTQSISAVIGREAPEAGRVVASTAWTAYLPHGTDVGPKDLLAVNGRRYEVVDSDAMRSDAVVTAVNLRRVE